LPQSASQNAGMHVRLILQFEEYRSSNPERQASINAVGGMLRKCRDLRTDADYNLDRGYAVNQARDTISIARAIGKRLQNLAS
jgi:hypothetical protein